MDGVSVDSIINKRKQLEKTHKIKQPLEKRKRRYVNGNSTCPLCKEEIPFLQQTNLLQHCTGVRSTPVSLSGMRDYGSFSRRCLEIAEKRLAMEREAVESPRPEQPTRVSRLRFGLLDGESLTEVAPRRKRRRRDNSLNESLESSQASTWGDALPPLRG